MTEGLMADMTREWHKNLIMHDSSEVALICLKIFFGDWSFAPDSN
jgi:hypothetical protein